MNQAPSFPTGKVLQGILNLQTAADLDDYFSKSLMEPLQNMFARPRKDLRSQLVRLGFLIASRRGEVEIPGDLVPQACEILEVLHAGSLIIDDIEDGTSFRRGEKALHLQVGVPIALNAGNWLYFLPFQKIEQMNLPLSCRARIASECQKTLLRAHYGQALDVGIPIDTVPQEKAASLSLAAMELKSGVLAGFALKLGALAAHCEEPWFEELDRIGRRLGLSLQMFDDIGNLSSKANSEKKGEDLKLRRPSFLFAVASESLSNSQYREFLGSLESVDGAISYIQRHRLDSIAKTKALAHLKETLKQFEGSFQIAGEEQEILSQLFKKLVQSYE